jgi:hypothetical protein
MSGALRYSPSRDAYVLKGVGRRIGPVFKLRQQSLSERSTDATLDEVALARDARDTD